MTVLNLGVRPSIATDQHPVYECFAPLTAAVWRHHVGFEPLVTLVGYEEEWLARPRSRLVMDELRKVDIQPLFVATPEGYRSANLAQVARMYAALERSLADSDVVITADIDMWPLDREWFCRHLPNPGQVTAYYANFPSRYPMCYVAANRRTWCEMLAPNATDQGRTREPWLGVESARAHLCGHLTPQTAPADAWQHDEEFLTSRIRMLHPARLVSVRRPDGDPFPDRIDRVCWPHAVELGGKKDAHLLRPAHVHWSRLGELFRLLCPSLVDWADKYIARYATLLSEDPQP